VILLLLPAYAFAMKSEPEGVQGINWGDAAAEHQSVLKEVTEGGSAAYVKTDDTLQFGRAKLTRALYYFDSGGFHSVDLFFALQDGQDVNDTPVYREAVRRWGAPTSIRIGSGEGKEYTWGGDITFSTISFAQPGEGKLTISGIARSKAVK
jgi:hypothetical protein